MVRPLAVTALVVGLLAALVVVLLREEPGARPPAEGPAAAGADAAAPTTLRAAGAPEPAASERTLTRDAVAAGEPTAGPSEVVADRAGTLVLRVRAADGTPRAGVPLAIAVHTRSRPSVLWRGSSGEDGCARIDDLRSEGRAVAFVDAPLGARPRVEIDLAARPAAPVDIVLPRTGSLRVELDATRAAPVTAATVVVEEVGSTDDTALPRARPTPMRDGVARVPFVGLDLTFLVSVTVAGSTHPCQVEAKGPIGAGEERRVVVPLLSESRVLVARLLDAEGQPLPEVFFAVKSSARHRSSSSSSSSSTVVRSDAEARVRFVGTDRFGGDAERLVELRQDERDLEVELPVPEPWPAGETDLGDVRMAPAPVLAGGQVVDAAGQPVAGARLRVPAVAGAEAKSGDDGRFAVRSRAAAGDAELHASARGFLPFGPLAFAAGTTGLVVRLEAAGILAGEVLCDRIDARVDLRVVTEAERDGARQEHEFAGTSFELEHVVPGTHAVSIRLAGSTDPVATETDVVVRAGETTRLKFDLRGLLRRIAFTVVDEHGTLLPEASALIAADVGSGRGQGTYDGVLIANGQGAVVVRGEAAAPELLVFAPERCAVVVPALQDGQLVTLPKAPAVVVHVPAAALPSRPLHLQVELEPVDERFSTRASYVLRGRNEMSSTTGARPWAGSQLALVRGNGEAHLSVATSGRHRVRCWVARNDQGGQRRAEVEGVTPAEVTIAPGAGDHALRIEIDAGAVADAAASL